MIAAFVEPVLEIVEWVQFLMLNNAWISPSLKNFQGAQEWGVFAKIFTKFHKMLGLKF